MASPAKISANRRNGLLSTGPKSKAGKEKSSRNALKHGLTAETTLLPGEKIERYQSLHLQIWSEISPTSPLEEILTNRLISLIWRLDRIANFETAIFHWNEALHTEQNGKPHSTNSQPLENQENAIMSSPVLRAAQTSLGRCVDSVFDRDIICKLSRYESHLAKQAIQILHEIKKVADK